MRVLFAGRTPVVATVALRGAGFIAEAKSLRGWVVFGLAAAFSRSLMVPAQGRVGRCGGRR
jgi:hypothetical protein